MDFCKESECNDGKTGAQCNEFGVNQRLQQKNIKNGVFIILYLFQLNENSVLLRFSFPIIFHFEFRLKVTINQSFPSTVTPPSKSINVCQINEKGNFRRISHFYPNLRFPDCTPFIKFLFIGAPNFNQKVGWWTKGPFSCDIPAFSEMAKVP